MKIGLDGKLLTLHAGGIGRYAINLVRALLEVSAASNNCDVEFIIFTGPHTSRSLLASLNNNYSEHVCRLQSSVLRSLFSMPVSIARHGIKIFHGLDHVGIPLFSKQAKHVITVHDVIPLIFPHMFTLKHRLIVKAALARIPTQADRVIVPSYAVRQDVLQHLHIREEQVVVIPEGCEKQFQPEVDFMHLCRVKSKYKLLNPYILFLGTLQPRKNVTTLLQAFAQLRQMTAIGPELHLVLAGSRGWLDTSIFQMIQSLELQEVVSFPGFIKEEDLPALYHGALFFVYPSLYEGFGLPLLEAMACGIPVMTSNVSSMPEVTGDAALLINPYSVEEMAAAMHALVHNASLREHLRHKGLLRAQSFSWQTTARKTLDVYASL